MEIAVDNLQGSGVVRLLEEHLADMYATSPPESVHALDVEALKHLQSRFGRRKMTVKCSAVSL